MRIEDAKYILKVLDNSNCNECVLNGCCKYPNTICDYLNGECNKILDDKNNHMVICQKCDNLIDLLDTNECYCGAEFNR